MKPRLSYPILRIVAIFVVFSILWIFYSDRLVARFFQDSALPVQVQTYKGWFFVVATGVLLYWLIHREETVRKRVESDLLASRASFRELFSNNPNPMWVYDQETLRFLAVNDAAINKYGYSPDEFLQMCITDIRSAEDVPELEGYLASERAVHRDAGLWRHLTRDGRTLTVRVVSHQMRFAGREAVLVSVEDQTYSRGMETAYKSAEEKRIAAEHRISLDDSRLETLLHLSRMIEAPLQTIANYTLREAVRLTNSAGGYLAYRVEDQGEDCFHVYSYPTGDGQNPVTIHLSSPPIPEQFQDLRRATATGQPILSEGINGQASQLMVPMLIEHQVTAVAAVHGKAAAYEEADQRQLALLLDSGWKLTERQRILERVRHSQAQLMAAVESLTFEFWMQDLEGRYLIQNPVSQQRWGDLTRFRITDPEIPQEIRWLWQQVGSRAITGETVRTELIFPGRGELGIFDTNILPIRVGEKITGLVGLNIDITAVKQREHELQTMVSIAADLRAASRPEEIYPLAIESAASLLEVDAACLIIRDLEQPGFRVEQARGRWTALTGQTISENDATWFVSSPNDNEIKFIDWSNPGFDDHLLQTEGIRYAACIPLVQGPSVLGAICIGGPYQLTPVQISPLKAVADITASALNRTILNQQTEVHLQRMTALRSIDLAITSSLDVRVTLNILLNQISSQLSVDAADFLLYTAATQTLAHTANRGIASGPGKNNRIRLGESLAGLVALERQIKVIHNLAEYPDPVPGISELIERGFVSYIGIPLIAKAELKGVLQLYHRRVLRPSPDWFDFLQALSAQAAIAIDNAELFDRLQHTNNDLTLAYDATIEGWSRALELRDQEKEGHNNRVADMTVRLAKIVDVRGSELVHIRRGVLLHDIGKMAIPDYILLKAGPLTDDEWQIMRRHPQYSYEMLSNIPYLRPAIDIPFCHHERWDGMGYPRGLSGEEIPIAARLFSVVDIWDALRHERPYRTAWSESRVLEYIRSQSGRRLDPQIAETFLAHVEEFR